jgi:arginine:pyruvate transaminase
VLTRDEIVAIAELCRSGDLWLICDEVYAELCLQDSGGFVSPLDLGYDDVTISVSSISKSHALPGFRCGWAAGSAATAERIGSITEAMIFGAQPFLADATATALGDPSVTDTFRALVQQRAGALVAGLAGSDAVSVRMPEGGMFCLVDIRPTQCSGEEFAWALLEREQVVVMPGESFGAGGAGHVRVAMTVEASVMTEAARRIRRLAETLRGERGLD